MALTLGKRSEDRAGSDGRLLCMPCAVELSVCDSSEMNGIALAHLGGVRVINTSLRGLRQIRPREACLRSGRDGEDGVGFIGKLPSFGVAGADEAELCEGHAKK